MRGIHRIRVDGVSHAADRLRQYLHKSGYVLVPDSSAGICIAIEEGPVLSLDSVDSPLEARILANLQELVPVPVLLTRAGGNQEPDVAVIASPPHTHEDVARAVFRAIEQVANQTATPARQIVSTPVSRPWWRFWAVMWVVLSATSALAQSPPYAVLDANTGATLNPRVFVGLFTTSASGPSIVALPTALGSNGGLKVDIVGGASGTTDADDASIAAAQTTGISLALNQAFDGTVWRRVTFGTAGTASAQVWTVQGVASMTPLLVDGSATTQPISGTVTATATNLDVQIGGSDTVTVTATNLDVQSGGADVLSTTAHDAAFGTAGAADAQVRTVQGVASMTPLLVDGSATTQPVSATNLDVQSGGADLATTTQAGAIQTAVELIDNAISGAGFNITQFGGAAVYLDPCQREAKTFYYVDVATATTVEIANSVASEFFYICSVNLVTAAANNVLIAEDDTDGCGSLSAGVSSGGTTAAEGWNFAANGGLTLGNGASAVMKTTTAARYFCLITSAATQLSGVISYVSAP